MQSKENILMRYFLGWQPAKNNGNVSAKTNMNQT
jgi:hypothetical protein